MAGKRMFSNKITDDDNFTSLSSSAQALYFHLNQSADDDGFNNQVSLAMHKAHASADDLKVLMAKRYIIRFESGVIVIKHWRLHNTLRKDRYTPTTFQEELKCLGLKDNGAYTMHRFQGNPLLEGEWLPNGCQVVATDKYSIDKNSVIENNNSIDSAESIEPEVEQTASNKTIESEFEELWKLYPRKVGKAKALTYYQKARKKDTTFEEVKQGILNYCAEIKKKKTELRYVKHGSTWFNNQGWKDEYDVTPQEEPKRYGGTYL